MKRSLVLNSLALAAALTLLPLQGEAQDDEQGPTPAQQLTLDDLRTFTDVFNQARRNYVEPVDDRTLLQSAIQGMLADLDPHSAYLPPEQFAELEDNSRGSYSGVGVSL